LGDAVVTALAHYGNMKVASLYRSRMVTQGSAPRVRSHSALIANIKDTADNAAVAIELFEESKHLNVKPTSYLYNTIISRLAKARKVDYARMLFQAVKAARLQQRSLYGAIIAGCARNSDIHTAEVLFEEVRDQPGYQYFTVQHYDATLHPVQT
jgi:pentatricopeptide repeat protein